jgi:streptogramin lyase
VPSLIFKVPLPDSLHSITPHTLVRDNSENIYLSDEFNHSVFSLDQTGSLRWQAGGKGQDECRFSYPRGIALGRVFAMGEIRNCLAVCDAWNNRVQFFDLSGGYLCSWQAAGGRKFMEVCDIRFAANPLEDDSGCWYILDYGNHRLCVMGCDGQVLYELGKAFPPNLESLWYKMQLEPFNPPARDKIVHHFSEYEPLYYPAKILGQSETTLYLFEPLANQLKQPLLGFLFPLHLRPPKNSEWISATEDVFLAWDRTSRCFSWLDGSGTILNEGSIDKIPVSSDAGIGEAWMCSDGGLELWRFELPAHHAARAEDRELFTALLGSAKEEMVSGNPASLFRILLAGVSRCFAMCDQFLDAVRKGCRDITELESILAKARSSWCETVKTGIPSSEQMRDFRLLSLKLPILVRYCDSSETLRVLCAEFDGSIKRIMDSITESMHHHDEALLLRHQIQRCIQETDMTAISGLAELVKFQIVTIKQMLFCCGMQPRRMQLQKHPSPSSAGSALEDSHARWIAPLPSQFFSPVSRCLHELARFSVLPFDAAEPPNPQCVVRTLNGDYFVTLFSRGTLAHLDAEGNYIEELFGTKSGIGMLLRPAGLAADRDGRLWIVEQSRKSVRIFDPCRSESGDNSIYPDTSGMLVSPVGIAARPDGSMLVVDLGSQRLISLCDSEPAKIFCDRVGTGPGEFRCPTSICASVPDADSGYWIVDQRNHRLQKLDRAARFVQQAGKCGPGPGSFLTPWFVAQFADGILAVSQCEIEPCLKLISPDGVELDCMFLEYLPAGIYIHDEKLIVAEWDGRSIRIYERTH